MAMTVSEIKYHVDGGFYYAEVTDALGTEGVFLGSDLEKAEAWLTPQRLMEIAAEREIVLIQRENVARVRAEQREAIAAAACERALHGALMAPARKRLMAWLADCLEAAATHAVRVVVRLSKWMRK